jgi:hypothetical protein
LCKLVCLLDCMLAVFFRVVDSADMLWLPPDQVLLLVASRHAA